MVEGGLKNNDAGKDGVSLIMLETFGAPSVVDAITEWRFSQVKLSFVKQNETS